MTKKEIAKKEQALPSTELLNDDWGCEGMHASDVLIPKLLLMQGQSDFVADGKAVAGDIVKSTNCEVVAKRGEQVAIIPIMTSKGWRIMEQEGGRFEFRKNEPWTPENDKRDLDWEENGSLWRADRTLNFYVMLPKDILAEKEAMDMVAKGKTPDNVSVLTPCLVQFVRTSYNAGKAITTHFAMAKQYRRPPAAWWLNLSTSQQTNEQNKYFVMEISNGGVTEMEHLRKCREWYDIIRSTDVKVHEETTEAAKPSKDASNPSDKF